MCNVHVQYMHQKISSTAYYVCWLFSVPRNHDINVGSNMETPPTTISVLAVTCATGPLFLSLPNSLGGVSTGKSTGGLLPSSAAHTNYCGDRPAEDINDKRKKLCLLT